MNTCEKLVTQACLADFIQTYVSLNDKNWFRTGGSARFYCEPQTIEEFRQALSFAHAENLEIFVLGQGANILVSDDGFDGLVIRPQLLDIEIIPAIDGVSHPTKNTVLIKAGAGVTMETLIQYCLDNYILGLEEFSGIPGTVGGSVFINLHYFEFLLEQFVVSAEIINKKTGEISIVSHEWFSFGYDQSQLHAQDYYLVNATFKLQRCSELEAVYARGRRTEIIRHRVKRYPSHNTCGSFFRNFHDHEVTLISNGKKMIYVAYYLDKIGVKGELTVGNATVSYQHANMIVNRGNATSSDIVALVRTMQQLVYDQFDIIPQPECQLIGFKKWPLLK
jgi:UDP-N-acetylmuramate dehydrogenase